IIRWEINEVSKLAVEIRQSPIKFCAGLPWRVVAGRNYPLKSGNAPYLAIVLHCNDESDCDEWSAETDFTLTLLNSDPTKNDSRQVRMIMIQTRSYRKPRYFVSISGCLEILQGFIKDDKIVI
ncbi:hypothetical protein PFISCL1PPCAC_20986, partial [Pristionchus fissidentatus]